MLSHVEGTYGWAQKCMTFCDREIWWNECLVRMDRGVFDEDDKNFLSVYSKLTHWTTFILWFWVSVNWHCINIGFWIAGWIFELITMFVPVTHHNIFSLLPVKLQHFITMKSSKTNTGTIRKLNGFYVIDIFQSTSTTRRNRIKIAVSARNERRRTAARTASLVRCLIFLRGRKPLLKSRSNQSILRTRKWSVISSIITVEFKMWFSFKHIFFWAVGILPCSCGDSYRAMLFCGFWDSNYICIRFVRVIIRQIRDSIVNFLINSCYGTWLFSCRDHLPSRERYFCFARSLMREKTAHIVT